MTPLQKLNLLSKVYGERTDPYAAGWGYRCACELQYAWNLSRAKGGLYDRIVLCAVEKAWNAYCADGALTATATGTVEEALSPLADEAKKLGFICVGHAHIDMNWKWGYNETVSIALDTFRTMLDLMKEYPEFTFGQSQASVYRIVEMFEPDMIPEIKTRVHEGRWEVTASTWVEADRNMPNMESMARHLLYAKRYLSGLLDVRPASLDIDYEPDTFGHHINVPEILCDGGVKYYYHCRGFDKHILYNWKAPSGRQILCFNDPAWYNSAIDGRCALMLPEFCRQYGLNAMLRVYGVGDHGGGPTRRDIERILDMNRWPVFPEFRFGANGEFFRLAERNRQAFPTVESELNFIFDGCYTTQTRQKKGNRMGEALLSEAEGAIALTRLAVELANNAKTLTEAWKKLLFNQFHDILPGSGVVDTREYAMGQYQEIFAAANTVRTQSVRALSDAVDTSAFTSDEDISMNRSEGAGVGYGLNEGRIAQTGRHAGRRRLFTVFNPLPRAREELAGISVWDWNGDSSCMRWSDSEGSVLSHQVISTGTDRYWGHKHADVLVRVRVPAMGYTTVALDENDPALLYIKGNEPQVDQPLCGVLENECIRAELDIRDGGIVSLVDKTTGREYAKPGHPMGIFRLIEEDAIRGMSAWRVGKYRRIATLNRGVCIRDVKTGTQYLRQSIEYETAFGSGSHLKVTVSLDRGEATLRFDITVRWQEIGSRETCYPQLNFYMPVAYDYSHIRYDVPMGAVDRTPLAMDVPAQSYGMPVSDEDPSLMLISDSKYGYRGSEEGLSVTLIRSSADPDPWPEIGEHRVRMAIALCGREKAAQAAIARTFCRELIVTAAKAAHKGTLPLSASLMEFVGDGLVISAVKIAEDGNNIAVRYYEIEGRSGEGKMTFYSTPKKAIPTNLLEQPAEGWVKIDGNTICFQYRAYRVGTLLICFE